MKMTPIITLALLGLIATLLVDAADAKPGNGRGQQNRPTAEATTDVDVEDEVDFGRGNRPTRGSSVGEVETGYLPTELEDEYSEARGRISGSLPPGIQRQIERGDGLPPGLQRQVERDGELPPGLRQ